ncbi:hypothetical protein HE1_00035 [Holospora elegans E1]|uniref:Transposase DDE domain-containing protein n=1 Tax=Holospora elegans E1 TaxID=1427503 RepID=A0A023DWP1_9PROT|nr:hypothetical protein HE1_00035 [Holospora elegans E1]
MEGKKIRKQHSGVDKARQSAPYQGFIRPMTQVLGAEFLKKHCKNILHKREFVRTLLNKTIALSEHISQEWAILPKCWIVERTYAWLNHLQRVSNR